ncbi:MAG: arginine decarboxylase, pyruvoyl-dependent [Deltaproteobacteria bacterium]|nr:MAG: arginine decarboxylase, pyruvoyl-dependent [Deltaproteobacteria bacterium]
MIPTKAFLTKGVGRHRERLASFELALRHAGIAQFNLVTVSSIFPPHCKIVSRAEGLRLLTPGQIVYTVLSRAESNEPHRHLAASVGVAIPRDRSMYGYLSEHHAFGQTDEQAGDYAEDLAAQMLATILNLPFDPDKSYDERRDFWRLSGQIVKTTNVSQSARCGKDGLWTSVVAACVLIEA